MKTSIQYMLLFLTALLLYSCSDDLSDYQKESFIKFYGSYQADVGQDIQVLSSGGYAITGSMQPTSATEMFLIITDQFGNQIPGSPTYYGDTLCVGRSLLALKDGILEDGFILAGQKGDTLVDGTLQTDIYVVRTDAQGNEIWSKRFGGDSNETVFHIAKRTTGGYVLAGKKKVNGQDDLWIIMINENGEKISEFSSNNGIDDLDEARFILNTGSGYLVACTYNDGEFAGTDMMVLYLDEFCNVLDARAVGTEFNDYARGIVSFNGDYLIMGYSAKDNSDKPLHEIRLYEFSIEGNVINKNNTAFATITDGDTDFIGEACVVSSNGDIAIVGSHEADKGKLMLLQMVGAEGNIAEPILFGEQGKLSANSIKLTQDGGLVFTGYNELGGNSVVSLVKTNASGKF